MSTTFITILLWNYPFAVLGAIWFNSAVTYKNKPLIWLSVIMLIMACCLELTGLVFHSTLVRVWVAINFIVVAYAALILFDRRGGRYSGYGALVALPLGMLGLLSALILAIYVTWLA